MKQNYTILAGLVGALLLTLGMFTGYYIDTKHTAKWQNYKLNRMLEMQQEIFTSSMIQKMTPGNDGVIHSYQLADRMTGVVYGEVTVTIYDRTSYKVEGNDVPDE